jgi:phage/plasmid-like protein (TIGR03299 family)
MAHEINIRANGFAEIAFVGETPWHGLGQQLNQDAGIEEWRTAAGMDWEIKSAPVEYSTGEGHSKIFTGQNVLHRSDTKAPLSVVSNKYNIVQPADVLEFFRDLTEYNGFKLHTAGVLQGGKRLWALAETGKMDEVVKNDPVSAFVLLATSCDRGMATQAKFTSVRVVCANTLAIAEREGEAIRISHRSKFDSKSVQQNLGINVNQFDKFIYNCKHLASKQVTQNGFDLMMEKLLQVENTSEMPIHQNRAYRRILELFDGGAIGSDISGVRGTAWGFVNAVTEYIDYKAPTHSNDGRLNSAWFGRGENLKNIALNVALSA